VKTYAYLDAEGNILCTAMAMDQIVDAMIANGEPIVEVDASVSDRTHRIDIATMTAVLKQPVPTTAPKP
jgi:hypothetical protein